MTERHS